MKIWRFFLYTESRICSRCTGLEKELREMKKTELSTEIEQPGERVNKSESDYKKPHEKLDKYIDCKRRKYNGIKLIVPWYLFLHRVGDNKENYLWDLGRESVSHIGCVGCLINFSISSANKLVKLMKTWSIDYINKNKNDRLMNE